MHIQTNNQPRNLNKLPGKPAPTKEPEFELPKEKFSFADAAIKVAANAAIYGAVYYGGGAMGGGYGGTAAFGAGVYAANGAISGAQLFYNSSKNIEGLPGLGKVAVAATGAVGGGLLGAGEGALRGLCAYALGTTMGGGVAGAALGGAAVALGEVAYQAWSNR